MLLPLLFAVTMVAPAAPAATPDAAPGAPAPPKVTTPSPPAPVEPAFPRVVVSAGPAIWTRQVQGAVRLDVGVHLIGPLSMSLGTLTPVASTTEALPGGRLATVNASPVAFGLRGAAGFGRFSLGGGLETLLTFEEVDSRGMTPLAGKRRRVFAAGISASASYEFVERLLLIAQISGLRTVRGEGFAVAGGGSVLVPPAWQGVFSLSFGWAITP
jgi:hypothetical protein